MILRINVSEESVKWEEFPKEYQFLGGRGLTSRIISEEVDPKCHPLGESNKLIIAPGFLSGTSAPCSGRLSIGAKSPLTGGIKESNSGGMVSLTLAKMGIKAIIIEGAPTSDRMKLLKIENNKVEFLPADDLKGKGNYETVDWIKKNHGSNKHIISIGPAGEHQYSIATIAVTDFDGMPTRHCARGGLGAVMASKGIKGIVVDAGSENKITYHNRDQFQLVAKKMAKNLIKNTKVLKEYGTANLVLVVNELGAIPTKNFSQGRCEDAENFSGEKMREVILERNGKTSHICHTGCVIQCSNVYNDQNGEYLTASLEYETIAMFGSNIYLRNLDQIANLDRICDDLGVDTIELGGTLGVAMEGGHLNFGDYDGVLELINELREGTFRGKLFGQGAQITGKVLGVKRIPTVKNQSMAAYDPRVLQGTAATYATTPMGADHTAGNILPGRVGYREETQGQFDYSDGDSMLEISKDSQVMAVLIDNMGLCYFIGTKKENIEAFVEFINAKEENGISFDELIGLGKKILRCEQKFNENAGISVAQNDLPEFFRKEELSPSQLKYKVSKDKLEKIFEDF